MKLLSVIFSMLFASSAFAANMQIDATHSSVVFRVGHMGISNVYGRFNDVSGSFTVNDTTEQLTGINITVKAASVDTGVVRRDNHLQSADFFNATQFPDIKFVSTAVTVLEDGHYDITGNLSLHGITKAVILRAEKIGSGRDAAGNLRVGGEGTLTLKRSDYGMTGLLNSAGDDVKLLLAFEGFGR